MPHAARSRSVRLAFLVEDCKPIDTVLDDIFATCYGLHGGRFALIVPVVEGTISKAYWSFLTAHDPDIIYSYVKITGKLENSIHELIYPSYLLEHEEDAQSYRPALPFEILRSTSMLPMVCTTRTFVSPTRRPFLIDHWPSASPDRFLLDNFGTRLSSESTWERHRPDHSLAPPLYFAPQTDRHDPRSDPDSETETFEDNASLLERMGSERILSVAQLSAYESRRREYHVPSWADSVHLFVGDSYQDRIAFWNARLLIPSWLDNRLVSLRATSAHLEDPRMRAAITTFLQHNSNVRSTGSGSGAICITSVSLGSESLAELAQSLKGKSRWAPYTSLAINGLDALVPGDDAIQRSSEMEGSYWQRESNWKEMQSKDSRISVPTCTPRHVELISSEHRQLRTGFWAIDCDLQRTNNLSRFSNVHDHWRLPRKLRMVGSFVKTTESPRGRSLLVPRATRSGLLSVFGSYAESPFTLSEPEDQDAFRYALVAGKDWWPPRPRDRSIAAEQIVSAVEPSDAGRYFLGVLQQFGSLHDAQEVLLHRFWAERFEELGASPVAHESSIEEVSQRLLKRRANFQFDLKDEEQRRSLAEMALNEAGRLGRERRYLSFKDLHNKYSQYISRYDEANPPQGPVDPEYLEYRARTLQRSIQFLCKRGILNQGYEWLCPRCLHRNWVGIERLERQLTCGVCGHGTSPEVDRPWDFQLNDFIRRAVADHGVLPLLWTTSRIQQREFNRPFFYLGPTDLYFDDKRRDTREPNAEVDLIVASGTEVILVECKSSERKIDSEKLIAVSKRIQPDVLAVAIIGPQTQRMKSRIADIRQGLSDTRMRVELLCWNRDQADSPPWLPCGSD